jgi:hypothetical protein
VRSPHRSSKPSSASSEWARLMTSWRHGVTAGQPVQSPKVRYLVTSGHPGVKPPLLGHVPPLAAILLAHAMTVVPYFASVGIQDSQHDPQLGGLSGPVRSQQPRDHCRGDFKAHCVQGQPGRRRSV